MPPEFPDARGNVSLAIFVAGVAADAKQRPAPAAGPRAPYVFNETVEI